MSRVQSSLPVEVERLEDAGAGHHPHVVPSVTGDGDDMFCLRSLMVAAAERPLPQRRALRCDRPPRARERRSSAVATLRKMRSSQMIGVAPLRLGIGSFHAMFSAVDHFVGSPFSLLMPLAADRATAASSRRATWPQGRDSWR